MRLQNLRRWHWVVLGALTGVAIGGARAAWGPAYRYSTARTLSQPLFESATLAPPGASPRVSDLVVHPPDERGAIWVTGRYEQAVGPGADGAGPELRTIDFKFRAPVPYRPRFAVDAPDPAKVTVADYLDQVAARVPQAGVSYRYAWEERPALGLLAWLAGSTLLIGGLWPVVLRRLPGAVPETAFAKSPDPGSKRAAHPPAAAPARRVAPAPSPDAVLDAYFAAVGGAAPSAPGDVGADTGAVAPTPILRLAAAPLEPVATPVEDHKDYGGEYYPTVVHGKDPRPGQGHSA